MNIDENRPWPNEEELKRHNSWCAAPLGVLIHDPEFKIGREIKEARKSGKPLFLVGRRRKAQ